VVRNASGEHVYSAPGVYSVKVTVDDQDGGIAALTLSGYMVAYDPTAGFVTGGGWIQSPPGALPADPLMTGKATFGFVAKYAPGAHAPDGNTAFQFHAAELKFKSTSYDWLVVAGAHAKYKGEGTVNGIAGFVFALTARDGDLLGSNKWDGFRIRIARKADGGVIYDNQPNQPDFSDDVTALGGGSIQVHK
jgi:hypothetical protein